jgi:hypothetical protein
MPYSDLPSRRERSAPVLDAADPSTIWQYFEDLEVLFARHRVSDDAEKKRAATRYPSLEVERLWQSARAFSDPARTYADFKEEVIHMYPEIARDRMHMLADLEEAIRQAARKDIRSEAELGVYYRRFLLVSRYLIERGRFSLQEQSRAFLRGFRPSLEAQVRERLQTKFLDHIPGDPYVTGDIFDAARFVLARNRCAATPEAQGPSGASYTLAIQTPVQIADTADPASDPAVPDADPTSDALDKLAETIAKLREMVEATTQTRAESAEPAPEVPEAQPATSRPRRERCKFCGREGHVFRDCVIIGDYVTQGRCRYSPLGNVVLSTGAAVPGGIPGAWMHNRVDKWHQQHPGQLAKLVLSGAGATPTTVEEPQGQAVEYPDQRDRTRTAATYIPDSPEHRRPEPAQAEQRSEAFQSARRGEVAAETSESEEQRPEPVRAYAYRTTVDPGVRTESVPVSVAAPEPAAITLPLRDLLAILARASAEVRSPVSKERQPQAAGASDRSGGLAAVEALAIRKCEEAVAAQMPVASATAVPVGPEASMPRPTRAVAQTEPAVAQPDPESIQ